MGVVDGAIHNVSRTVSRAASATTAAAGAVGGAAVNGVVGAVTGAAAGVQKGIDTRQPLHPRGRVDAGRDRRRRPRRVADPAGRRRRRLAAAPTEQLARRRRANRVSDLGQGGSRQVDQLRAAAQDAGQADAGATVRWRTIAHPPLTLSRAPLPLRAVSALVESLGTAASTGLTMAVIPVREGARALSAGLPAPTLTRHSWRGRGRAWVEVRGLDGPDGAELGRFVVDAVRARLGREIRQRQPPTVPHRGDTHPRPDLAARSLPRCRRGRKALAGKRYRRQDAQRHPPEATAGRRPAAGHQRVGGRRHRGRRQRRGRGPDPAVAASVRRRRGAGGGRRLPATGAQGARRQHRPLGHRRGACRWRWWWRTSWSCHRRRWPSTWRWKF